MLIEIKHAFSLQLVQLIVFSDVVYGKEISFLERQNDYAFTPEWFELVRQDKQRMPILNINTFKFNRTCTAKNFTLMTTVDVGYELQLVVQGYKFTSNEYRTFALRFQINFCEALFMNVAGLSGLLKCGNFTGCPIKKGIVFHMCNFVPDGHKLPPFIPSGRYMAEFQNIFRFKELYATRGYAQLVVQFVFRKMYSYHYLKCILQEDLL